MGNTIMGRMEEMGSRMDELERSIAELMLQAGLDPPAGSLSPPLSTPKSDDNPENKRVML